MTLADADVELTSTSESAGDLTAAWELTDGTLTISGVDASGLEVTTTATMDGEALDLPEGSAEDAIEALPPTSSTATCDAGALALVTSMQSDEDTEPVTITYLLRR